MQSDFVKPLLIWYNAAKRDLPWRHTKDPYSIWVSEIMLQQTRVEAVRAYYLRFMEALPDVQSLAACPDDALLKLWEGLGYYSRVRNMKKAAQLLMESRGGRVPETKAELLVLPGIGSYTAAAVASIAFGERTAAVDGNVLRVFARMTALRENILLPAVRGRAEEELTEVMGALPEGTAGDFTQAMIELGALVCMPGSMPLCGTCPIRDCCDAFARELQAELPVRIRKTERRVEERTVLLVRDGGETAIRRRPEKGLLAGLYEFPCLEGFVPEDDALRAVEAAGYEAVRIRRLADAKHLFSHIEWRMRGYEIRIGPRKDGRCEAAESKGKDGADDWIFAERDELISRYALPSAYSAYLHDLRG